MKTKRILKRLEEIEKIAKFQQKRLKDKKAFKKLSSLKQSLEIICSHTLKILEDLK